MHMVVGCSSCSHDGCPLSNPESDGCPQGNTVLTGWRFSLACALIFLLPILLAISGSIAMSGKSGMELIGGVSGFFIGFILTCWLTRICAISA
ncbi:MAG: hypothetical protein BWY82_00706 [Verrucomicrobia bacterium ADurb.Bin474]|nr:MAG: hypothetical protein BWY82_00706 [Verrucomicrobia bacterium ADurb.Bin474]